MDPDTLLKGGAALAAGLVLHAMAQPKQPAKNRKGSAYDGKVCSSWQIKAIGDSLIRSSEKGAFSPPNTKKNAQEAPWARDGISLN